MQFMHFGNTRNRTLVVRSPVLFNLNLIVWKTNLNKKAISSFVPDYVKMHSLRGFSAVSKTKDNI